MGRLGVDNYQKLTYNLYNNTGASWGPKGENIIYYKSKIFITFFCISLISTLIPQSIAKHSIPSKEYFSDDEPLMV